MGFEVDLHAKWPSAWANSQMTNIPGSPRARPGLQAKWDAAGPWINKERLVAMDFFRSVVDAQLCFVTRKNDAILARNSSRARPWAPASCRRTALA